jgi:hypothetical protein
MKRWIKKNWLYIAAVLAGAILTPYASNPQWYKDGDNRNGESEFKIAFLSLLKTAVILNHYKGKKNASMRQILSLRGEIKEGISRKG